MTISDEILRDNQRFNLVREALREEACGWGRSERDKNLKARYWNARQSEYFQLKVHWDYRPLANRLNWEAPDDYLCSSSLYECESQRLFALLSHNHNLRFDHIFEQATANSFLRVVSHWETGTALTPPIVELRADGKLGKIDGFHRLAVAFAAKVSPIPFWAVLPVKISGVKRISLASCYMEPNGCDEKLLPQ